MIARARSQDFPRLRRRASPSILTDMSFTGSAGAADPKELNLLLIAEPDFDAGPLAEALRERGYRPAWMRVESASALRAKLFARRWNGDRRRPGAHLRRPGRAANRQAGLA